MKQNTKAFFFFSNFKIKTNKKTKKKKKKQKKKQKKNKKNRKKLPKHYHDIEWYEPHNPPNRHKNDKQQNFSIQLLFCTHHVK